MFNNIKPTKCATRATRATQFVKLYFLQEVMVFYHKNKVPARA